MKRLALPFLIGGCLVAAWLVFAVGPSAIISGLHKAGWTGLFAISGFHLIATTLMGIAWWTLQRAGKRRFYVWGRLLRDAGSELLPLSQIGGYVLAARAPILHGVDRMAVAASVIVDATLEFCAQIAFILLGVALLMWISHAPALAAAGAGWLLPAVAAIAAFVVVQTRRPDFFRRLTERFARRSLGPIAVAAAVMHAEIGRIYRSKDRLLHAFVLHLAAWLVTGVEAWLTLRLIGLHCSIFVVLALESMLFATRSVTFMVPAAIGVQESAYLLLGASLGLPADMALALSLMKRARDLVLGVPALVSWHVVEHQRSRRGERGRALSEDHAR